MWAEPYSPSLPAPVIWKPCHYAKKLKTSTNHQAPPPHVYRSLNMSCDSGYNSLDYSVSCMTCNSIFCKDLKMRIRVRKSRLYDWSFRPNISVVRAGHSHCDVLCYFRNKSSVYWRNGFQPDGTYQAKQALIKQTKSVFNKWRHFVCSMKQALITLATCSCEYRK